MTSVAVGKSDRCSLCSLNAGGGLTITIPPHFGQARICPIAAWSRTLSRDLQVVQVMENRSMGKWDSLRLLRGERLRQRVFFRGGGGAGGNQDDLIAGVVWIGADDPDELLVFFRGVFDRRYGVRFANERRENIGYGLVVLLEVANGLVAS